VLMRGRFDADVPAMQRELEEALNLLEQQTYIQRNGDVYEYLTNEEKDVEKEIKNTEVSTDLITEELDRLIFESTLKDRKIRYGESNQDYTFARKVDDKLMGRQHELAIHVVTPLHDNANNPSVLRMQAMGRDEVLVLLPINDRLVRELKMYKRTDKYVRQNLASAQQPSVQRILAERQTQNQLRLDTLRKLVAELLGQATIVVNGQELEIGSTDGVTRVLQGFQELISRTYSNLRMLRGVTYREEEIATYLQPSPTLFGEEGANLSEAEQEMLAVIQANNRNGLRTTMQALVNRFERKPYGWYLAAIQCTLAKLCARGKVEVRLDANVLEGKSLEQALRNTRGFDNVLIEPQIDFTVAQVRQLKEFFSEFFDGPPLANEAKALGMETAAAFATLGQTLAMLRAQAAEYPFLSVLDAPMAQIQAVTGKSYSYYLVDLRSQTEALLDAKEQILDPIRRFMGGAQRDIYTSARRYLATQEPNLTHVAGDDVSRLRALLDDPACFNGNRMNQAKGLLDGLRQKVAALVKNEQQTAVTSIEENWKRLAGTEDYSMLTDEQQKSLRKPFDELKNTINQQTIVAVIRDTNRGFQEKEYSALLAKMVAWAEMARKPDVTPGGTDPVDPPPVEMIPLRTLSVPFEKAWMEDQEDVDTYVAALKKVLTQTIDNGKRVQV